MATAQDRLWDAIVVGGGIMGSCAALSLAEKGLQTLMIEQFPLPHSRGSSHGKSRIIRLYYEQYIYAEMMPRAYKIWRELERISGKELMVSTGMLIVEPEDATTIPHAIGIFNQQNLPYETLNRAEIRKRYPQLNYPENYRGLLDPNAGLLAPDTCLKVIQDLFEKQGGTIIDGEKVESFTSSTNNSIVTVTTPKGVYRTKKLVLCTGPWAKDVLEKSGVNLPLRTMPGLSCFCKEKVIGSHNTKNLPIIYAPTTILDRKSYRFYATFPSWEYPGFVKIVSRGQPPAFYLHPDARDEKGHQEMMDLVMPHISKNLPGIEPVASITEPCVYTMSSDRDFIIDYHPDSPNILIAAGFSGHGFKLAPIVGEMLRDMVTGEKPDFDLTPFSLKRFHNTSKL